MLGLCCCSDFFLIVAWALHCRGFSCAVRALRGMQASVVAALELSSCSFGVLQHRQTQQLWLMGLVAPQHVGLSQTRDQSHVSCIGKQILYH